MYLYVISAIGMHMQMFHVSAVATTPDEQEKTSTLHTSVEFWHTVSSDVKHVVGSNLTSHIAQNISTVIWNSCVSDQFQAPMFL